MKRSKALLISCSILVAVTTALLLGELLIRFISPHPTMSPRREFSSEYGFLNYKNRITLHELPGQWRFIYTTNGHRNRGAEVQISNKYGVPNIVVLGDSYSFGVGVNDGEEYASVLARNLDGQFNVVNLAVGGWGLTQQIRRYYEFGQLYSPKYVLLQYCKNDIIDNYNYRVTEIESGRFVFVDSDDDLGWIKKYFSDSILQKSQIYSLIRDSLFLAYLNMRQASRTEGNEESDRASKFLQRQMFYAELLEIFARDLQSQGVHLVMISVNGQLDEAEDLRQYVDRLTEEGLIDYVEVAEYFEGVSHYSSPEGHQWGRKAHRILGDRLAAHLASLETIVE